MNTTLDLPRQSTPFIGRTRELEEIAVRLADPACRLLTLVGPGGIGKTRLALQAAADCATYFPHGVYFVPLQPLNSPDLLPSAIASALKIMLMGTEEPRLQIINYVRDKHLLLVLDNFEHLMDGVEHLVEIVQGAPEVKVLVTSRERLNVQEEWTLNVEGLTFPGGGNSDALENYPAIQLFDQRARQVQSAFSLHDNAQAITTICQQVEGMPLGIELAANWLRAMTSEQIAAQMARSVDFLATPLRNAPERHRSIRAVFEQSWTMLSPKERDVLMRLSVFRGGFELEAAEAVAGADLTLLASLADKSLIRLNAAGRYDLHGLLRQFAADKLTEASETIDTAQRHLDYFMKLAEAGEAHAYGREQIIWYDRLEDEIDNLRAALAWSLSCEEIEKGLRIAAALRWVWEMRGHLNEGFDWCEKLLPLSADVSPPVRIKALHRACEVAGLINASSQGDQWGTEALRLSQELNDRWNIAWSLSTLAFFASPSLAIEPSEIIAMLDESVSLFLGLDDPLGLSHALRRQSAMEISRGNYSEAQRLGEEALSRDREAGDKNASAWELALIGFALWWRDHNSIQALSLIQESIALFREIEDVVGTSSPTYLLAYVERERGNRTQAHALCNEVLVRLKGIGIPAITSSFTTLAIIGGIAAEEGQAERATRLLGALHSGFQRPDKYYPDRYHSDVALARSQLDRETFERAWVEGQAMTLEQAIDYALQDENTTVEAAARPRREGQQSLVEPLSAREVEVLRLLADGLSNAEIGQKLFISVATVKVHTRSIYGKLDVKGRVQAVNRAKEMGLV